MLTKPEILELIKLLSALEVEGVISRTMPDYLSDRVVETLNMLSKRLLEES